MSIMNTAINVLEKLESLRKENKLSQHKLAENVKAIGSQSRYNTWIKSDTPPSLPLDVVVALADYYHISLDELCNRSLSQGTFYSDKENQYYREKKAIGTFLASTMINESDSVIMDSGTTLAAVMKAIIERDRDNRQDLNIMTNNLAIYQIWKNSQSAVNQGIKLELTGGRCDPNNLVLLGDSTQNETLNFRPSKVILGTSGLSFDPQNDGIYFKGAGERSIKCEISTKPTKHRIIVCHHLKLRSVDSYIACNTAQLFQKTRRLSIITTAPTDNQKRISDISEWDDELKYQIRKFIDAERFFTKEISSDRFELIFINPLKTPPTPAYIFPQDADKLD